MRKIKILKPGIGEVVRSSETVATGRRGVHILERPGKRGRRFRRAKIKEVGYGRTVVICNVKKKKKRKKKFSRGQRPLHELAMNSLKAQYRFNRGNERALDRLIESSNKSARRKRDGARRDSLKNLSKAMLVQSKHHSRVIPGALNRLSKTRLVKRVLRP